MRVLIVDDFASMRSIIGNMVKEIFHSVTIVEADNGKKALEMIKKQNFDFILSDWTMPVMDGLTFLKSLRAQKCYDNLPVMMVTAEAKREHIIAAANAGADGYVVKPFSPEVIRVRIEKVLQRRGISRSVLSTNYH